MAATLLAGWLATIPAILSPAMPPEVLMAIVFTGGNIGALVGANSGTITASYGFGAVTGTGNQQHTRRASRRRNRRDRPHRDQRRRAVECRRK